MSLLLIEPRCALSEAGCHGVAKAIGTVSPMPMSQRRLVQTPVGRSELAPRPRGTRCAGSRSPNASQEHCSGPRRYVQLRGRRIKLLCSPARMTVGGGGFTTGDSGTGFIHYSRKQGDVGLLPRALVEGVLGCLSHMIWIKNTFIRVRNGKLHINTANRLCFSYFDVQFMA